MHGRGVRATGALLVAVLLLAAGACGGGDDSADSAATLPPAPAAGRGTLTIGATLLQLDVAFCDRTARPSDGGTTQLLRSEATSKLEGEDYVVRVTRLRTDEGAAKGGLTDTIEVVTGTREDPRGIQAKRSRIGDRWVDLRDPDARSELILVDGATIRAAGQFGPEGSGAGDPGLMSGQLSLTCPDV